MRLGPFFFFWLLLHACQMPALPSAAPQGEDGLLLQNVRLYSAEGNQLQLLGNFSEVRFRAEEHLLKSKHAKILWVAEQLHFEAKRLNVRLDTQEAWASMGWKFQTKENSFGEGSTAYGYKDKQGDLYAKTQEPLRLWQEGNTLDAEEANCEGKTRSCDFSGAVKTSLNKAR
jgi:hypothetical protein